jgi:uncharacterized protein
MDAVVLQLPSAVNAVFIYAAILGLIFVGLSAMTIRERRIASVSLGDGDNEMLRRRIRAHANFAEYVPIALILMAGAAMGGMSVWVVHLCGVALVAGRLLHVRAIYTRDGTLRIAGMAATLTVIGLVSATILMQSVTGA